MRVIQERDTNNTPTVSYTRGNDLSGTLEGAGGIGGLLGRSDGYSGGNWTDHNYYFADGNGNVTYLANSSQGLAASYRCDPFGNLISSSGTLASGNVYRFSSKEIHVNSGMYYYLYRFYDPNLQRWLSRDPLEEPGFKVMLAALVLPTDSLVSLAALVAEPNSYTFVDNTPISQVDYLGLIRSSYPAPDTGRSDPSPMPSPCGDFTNKDCREACDTAFGSKNAALQVCYKICKALKGKSCNALYRYCTHIAAHGDFGSQGGKICLGMYDVLCAGR